MAKNKDRKNQPRDFKAKAESQVQAKKDMHVENGEELISSENKSSHRIMDLTIESIKDNPHQPRQRFDEEALQDLAASIREHGLLNPILVRQEESEYYLVGGERRLRACKALEHETIRAIVIDANPEIASLIDNLQREDLHPMERALAISKLYEKYDRSVKKVAEMISTSENTVQRLLKLANLRDRITVDDDVTTRLTNNRIPLREFYELMRIEEADILNNRFQQLENKYSKDPNADPIQKRVRKVQDEIDRSLTYSKKILVEITSKALNKDDERLEQLRLELDRLVKKIQDIQKSEIASD